MEKFTRKENAVIKAMKAAQAAYKDVARGLVEVDGFDAAYVACVATPAVCVDYNEFELVVGKRPVETDLNTVQKSEETYLLDLGQGGNVKVALDGAEFVVWGEHNTPQGYWMFHRSGGRLDQNDLLAAVAAARQEHLYFQEYGAVLHAAWLAVADDQDKTEKVEVLLDWFHTRFGRDQMEWPTAALSLIREHQWDTPGVEEMEDCLSVASLPGFLETGFSWPLWRQAGSPTTGKQALMAGRHLGWLTEEQKEWEPWRVPGGVVHYTQESVYTLHRDTADWSLKALLADGKERLAKLHPATQKERPYMTAKALGLDKHLREGAAWASCNWHHDLRELFREVLQEGLVVPKGLDTSAYVGMDNEADCCVSAVRLSRNLGTAAGLVSHKDVKYFAEHCKTLAEVPAKFQKGVAISRILLEWVLEKGLEVNWTLGSSAKVCVIRTLMKIHGIKEDAATQVFFHASAMQAVLFAAVNPNEGVVDVLPEFEEELNGIRANKMAKQDIKNLYIGELSSCCQKLGGAGEAVCTEGWKDQFSANYVFSKGSTILAHMWVWESACGTLVIDSLEARVLQGWEIAPLVQMFVDQAGCPVALAECNYGVTPQVRNLVKGKEAPRLVGKLDYSYTDYKGEAVLLEKSH